MPADFLRIARAAAWRSHSGKIQVDSCPSIQPIPSHPIPSHPIPSHSSMSSSSSTASARRPFIGGNWKCNGTRKSVTDLVNKINSWNIPHHIVSSQNVSPYGCGAYTGEVAAEQLVDAGVKWTLIGHSERRQLFGATDEIVAKQIQQGISHGLHLIVCIGETESQRKANDTEKIISGQLDAIARAIPQHKDWQGVVLAYEPVWAIGTGLTATPQQAQEVHKFIRQWLHTHVGQQQATTTRIIYGGSVNGQNSSSLIAEADIDGFLVGGASLKDEFKDIIAAGATKNKS